MFDARWLMELGMAMRDDEEGDKLWSKACDFGVGDDWESGIPTG